MHEAISETVRLYGLLFIQMKLEFLFGSEERMDGH